MGEWPTEPQMTGKSRSTLCGQLEIRREGQVIREGVGVLASGGGRWGGAAPGRGLRLVWHSLLSGDV